MIAQLGSQLSLKARQPPSDVWEALYQRLVERDSLVDMRQIVRNQLHSLRRRTKPDPDVVERKQGLVDLINSQIKAIDREPEHCLNKSEWCTQASYLRSINGIGLLSVAWLLVITNGFSTCDDAEQLASYLGVVPHPNQSGSSRRGHKPTALRGHARARRVLYQASVSAAVHNSAIKAFYERLIARGKHVKVARIAATRKLIHIAFAVATKKQLFDPNHACSQSQSLLIA